MVKQDTVNIKKKVQFFLETILSKVIYIINIVNIIFIYYIIYVSILIFYIKLVNLYSIRFIPYYI